MYKSPVMSDIFPVLPTGRFSVIYADPPWQYERPISKSSVEGVWDLDDDHYPTVAIEDLMKLDVKSVSDDDCILFLWVTAPLMKKGIALGEAWGFKYSTIAFVWDKVRPVFGAYTHSQCEFVLVFRRGKRPEDKTFREKQFLSETKAGHSVKPDEIRQRIERMYPSADRLELFARQPYEGWTVWGLECDGETKIVRKSKGFKELVI